MRKGVFIAAVCGLVIVAGLAVGSRYVNDSSLFAGSKVRTSDVITVGVVGNFSQGRLAPASEMLSGVRLWEDRIEQTRGIPYNSNEIAAVKLETIDDRGSPTQAARAARTLVNRGATVLFGPPNSAELAAVAAVAVRSHVPLFSPMPRPLDVPRSSVLTFLDRRSVGDFTPALDALDRAVGGKKRGRIVILTSTGEWALDARRTARLAQQRAYTADVVRVTPGNVAPSLSIRPKKRLQAVFVSAPLSIGLRWFRGARPTSSAPWILAAVDVRSAVPMSDGSRVAVVVPWSPTSTDGGPFFGPREFMQAYEDDLGRLPTADSAAGAALGVVLSQAVQLARSTDVTRILAARDRMDVNSLWGRLSFVNGEQRPTHSYLVLLDRGGVRAVPSGRGGPETLALSTPPKPATRRRSR